MGFRLTLTGKTVNKLSTRIIKQTFFESDKDPQVTSVQKREKWLEFATPALIKKHAGHNGQTGANALQSAAQE